MKKILMLSLSLFVATTTYAELPLGVKIGISGANMINLPEGANNTMKESFYAGVFTELDLGYGFTLQPELIYARQGARINSKELLSQPESSQILAEGEINRLIRLNYINIPLVISYRVWGDLSLNLAPQLGINLNGKDHIEYNDRTTNRSLNGIKRCDFSLGVGVKYMIWQRLDVTVRYNMGLTNIIKSESAFNSHNIKNGALQVGLGFIIF